MIRHNMSKLPEYKVWKSMRRRCTNPKDAGYRRYGGRGITVCERWNDFANFIADMGPRPEGTSIDRIDNNGNYEPSNCRWADRFTQANNNRRNKWLEVNGVRKTYSQWANEIGKESWFIRDRLHQGLSAEDAVRAPHDKWRRWIRTDRVDAARKLFSEGICKTEIKRRLKLSQRSLMKILRNPEFTGVPFSMEQAQ